MIVQSILRPADKVGSYRSASEDSKNLRMAFEDSETLELDRNEQVDLADMRSMRVVVPIWIIRIYRQEQALRKTTKNAE